MPVLEFKVARLVRVQNLVCLLSLAVGRARLFILVALIRRLKPLPYLIERQVQHGTEFTNTLLLAQA